MKETFNFDRDLLIEKGIIDPYSRHQKKLTMGHLFPQKKDGYCDCGCGEKLTGRRTRWSKDECGYKAYKIYSIICSNLETVRRTLLDTRGPYCQECGQQVGDIINEGKYKYVYWDADHILPVYKGGGGTYLDNFQVLCKYCHKCKTKQDVSKGNTSFEGA